MSINKEFRSLKEDIKSDGRIIEGYAVVFESESEDLGFTEVIKRGAITDETIKKSDVFAKLNHDDNKILGRSRFGSGSLSLSVDEHGLKYYFEAPNTSAGDELIEYLSRGEIFASSFAFSVEKSVGEKWTKQNGKFYREINKVNELFDVSPVFCPAYSATSCSKRFQDIKSLSDEIEKSLLEYDEIADDFGKEILCECRRDIRALTDEEIKYFTEIREQMKSDDDEDVTDEVSDEMTGPTYPEDDTIEKQTESETDAEKENVSVDESDESNKTDVSDENETDETDDVSDEDTENKLSEKRNFINKNTMNNNFSLLRSIRNVVNNRAMNEIDAAVINAGATEMRSAGLNANGQIQLPAAEIRNISVENDGADVVATDVLDVLTPLMAKQVLNELGARQMSGLVGDVLVPVMTSANANFLSETGNATIDNEIGFQSVKLSPKRLSTVVAVSKQFIAQDGAGAEAAIRANIIDSLAAKFQSVVLGKGAATATQPGGLFSVADVVEIADFADLTDFEASAEEANVVDCKYVMSPKAKAALRNMARGASHVGNVYENGEVDGTKAVSVSDVKDNLIAFGDFSNCIYGTWGGGIDLVVDPYSLASQGLIKLVASVYVDFVNARPEAVKIGKIVTA